MDPLARAGSMGPASARSLPPVLKSLAWIGGALATVCALGVAAVLAVVFAASLVLIGLMAVALITLGGLAYRARRTSKPADPTLLEARNVGGHSWVAYGWDQRDR
jgi:hypothetical protein